MSKVYIKYEPSPAQKAQTKPQTYSTVTATQSLTSYLNRASIHHHQHPTRLDHHYHQQPTCLDCIQITTNDEPISHNAAEPQKMPNLKNDYRETTTSVPINYLRHHHPRFQDSPASHHTIATQSCSDHGHSIACRKASTLSLSQMNNRWETSQPLLHLLPRPPLPLSQPVTPKSGNMRAIGEATRGRSRNGGRRMKVRE